MSEVRLQLTYTRPSELLNPSEFTEMFITSAAAIAFVFPVDEISSLESDYDEMKAYIAKIQRQTKRSPAIPLMLIATKADKSQGIGDPEAWARNHGLELFITSAKDNTNINEAMLQLAKLGLTEPCEWLTLLLVGGKGSGVNSLLRRYTENTFTEGDTTQDMGYTKTVTLELPPPKPKPQPTPPASNSTSPTSTVTAKKPNKIRGTLSKAFRFQPEDEDAATSSTTTTTTATTSTKPSSTSTTKASNSTTTKTSSNTTTSSNGSLSRAKSLRGTLSRAFRGIGPTNSA